MGEEWLDNIFEQGKIISEDAYILENIAKSFGRVGNDKIADELFLIASDLHTARNKISTSIGGMLHNRVEEGQKALKETLLAALGATPKKED